MSDSETAPLNGSSRVEERDSEHSFHDDDSIDMLDDNPHKLKRDPLHVRILYALSFVISTSGLITAIWGYYIVLTSPFDDQSKKMEREGYEKHFWGMQSIVILLAINALWTGLNYRLASKGKQNDIWPLNMAYDFLIWALLIAFGVLNMVVMLWDRRLCDGVRDETKYAVCDKAMFKLLVVEMVAVNLGILVAVFHFILLIGRCCVQGRRNTIETSLHLRRRVREEEELLLTLIERRRQLTEENEALEARQSRMNRDLPPLPGEVSGDYHDNPTDEPQSEDELPSEEERRPVEEYLIDIAATEHEVVSPVSEQPPSG